ncbi:MAG: DUF1003 domain-containing protein [Gemmatimonadales bacterium]
MADPHPGPAQGDRGRRPSGPRRARQPSGLSRNAPFEERLSDGLARVGGSWSFIIAFMVFLGGWALLNTEILGPRKEAFDPYPYVFLNLLLSMLAALQAPVIMMAQNRQTEADRLAAAGDYQVNLKAEFEIQRLHDKMDELRERRWSELVAQQQEQIRLLQTLLERQGA